MTDTPVAALDSHQDIPCMLLPMVGHSILLPTTSVAEMSPVKSLQRPDDAPDWLLGYYSWRGLDVPVLSLEGLNGGATPPLNPKGRIAVLNNTGVSASLSFIAVHTQGIPRMVRVEENDISQDDSSEKRPFDVMSVKVGLEEFYLPDIPAMEAAYVNTVMHGQAE